MQNEIQSNNKKLEYAESMITQFNNGRLPISIQRYATAEYLRKQFISDYPIERIPHLSLDDFLYAKEGQGNPKSFCRRIQHELKYLCSMGNAFPSVYGIYYKDSEISLSKTYNKIYGTDYESAFKDIKDSIVHLLVSFSHGDYQTVADCKLNSLFRYKLLTVYFPDKLIPVCTKHTLDDYYRCLNLSFNPADEMVYRNIALLQWKNSISDFSGWNNAIFMHFCDWLRRLNLTIDGNVLKDTKNKLNIIFEIDEDVNKSGLTGETREAIVKIRVNQSVFRDMLLTRYKKCCLCGISNQKLLIASHIKPWAVSEADEKLDPDNGFLMCPNHDKLFDLGLITFQDSGKIMISDQLESTDRIFSNINENMKVSLTEENKHFLSYHRDNKFQK